MKTDKDVTDCRGRAARDWLRGQVSLWRPACYLTIAICMVCIVAMGGETKTRMIGNIIIALWALTMAAMTYRERNRG